MKKELLKILLTKIDAVVDEDHNPFAYGHNQAVDAIMEYFCNKEMRILLKTFPTNTEIYEFLESKGYPEEIITRCLPENRKS